MVAIMANQLHVGTDCMVGVGFGACHASVGICDAVAADQIISARRGQPVILVDAAPRGIIPRHIGHMYLVSV